MYLRLKTNLRYQKKQDFGYIKLRTIINNIITDGEAQRIKLATELSKRSTGKTLYVLDEPTTGLHIDDIAKLIEILNRLVDAGNTAVIIEHNLDLIKTADYIIDLGKEGGEAGGTIIAKGTPEKIMKEENSYTGKYLKIHLDREEERRNKKENTSKTKVK